MVEATEEMSVSLQRTAYSTNIKTRLDYSCAFVDAQGRMVTQAFCQPAHLVTIGRLMPRAVEEYGEENLEPFLEALHAVLKKARVKTGDIAYLVHGTTAATNTIIEGKIPKTVFIISAGFGNMLEIGREVRPSL